MTPYEAWYEKRPNANHFKVFGCLAYAHIPNQNRQKLDAKSEPCIFVGYSEERNPIDCIILLPIRLLSQEM